MARSALAAACVLLVAAGALAQSGRVGGTVKDEDGQPIKGAVITAEFPDVATVGTATAITDDKGRFSMVGLRFGEWMFAVQAPAFMPQGATLNVRTGSTNAPLMFVMHKAFVAPSALGALSPKDVQTALVAADELYGSQRWDEAIAAYRGLLSQAPSLNVIHLQIAAAYRHEKAYDAAIAAYTDLLKIDPSSEKARIGIAMTNVDKGDLDAADRALGALTAAPGATREAFFSLGEVKLARSENDAAAAAFQRAAQLDHSWGKPPLALGRLAMNKSAAAAAAKYFQTVIDVDPMSPEAAEAKTLLEQIRK